MTTIACDARSMAGDGQLSQCGTIVGTHGVKVRALQGGGILGSCGSTMDLDRVATWIEGGREAEKPTVDDDFGAIWLTTDGSVFSCGSRLGFVEGDLPTAIGSGMDLAIGAMEAGASAEQAVAIAAKRDPFTGGAITVEYLNEGEAEWSPSTD